MTTDLLTAIRRLPLRIAKEYAGRERISFATFKAAHPDGYFYWEDRDDDGYFTTLEALAEAERKSFEPEIDELNIPYVMFPCAPIKLKAPSAEQLLLDAEEDQDAPSDYPAADSKSLQGLLDWWFANNTKPWWTPEYNRIIVLLSEERRLLYKLITGKEYKDGNEPNESEFLNTMSSDDVIDHASAFDLPVYNVSLLVERKLSGDPLWNAVDSGQEATPVDEEVKSLCDELEHEGWSVAVQGVELVEDKDELELADTSPDARSTGDDAPDSEDEDDVEDVEDAANNSKS